ncbi:MAG: TIGR01777 family oxidoreductase [Planctomycetes bacterium]|nr:TIGR01777 family oxidoreductase [Planctomycetota bacterium]
MHVLVSGGTGFIGKPLVERLLTLGHSVTVVSRTPAKVGRMFGDKPAACSIDALPDAFDGVINLAGASLDQRWTSKYKKVLVESRVRATETLRKAAEERGATAFISSSAIGYYGDRGEEACTEDSAPGSDFLADICIQWEAAAASDKLRVALVRTGVVLHHSGGALGAMLPIFKWFLGGRLGSGRQYWSWIHLDDIVRLFIWALENNDVRGPLNGSALNPVTNRKFTKTLAKAVHRPVSLPVPGFALRLLYGEMADMLLNGQKVLPSRTRSLGFSFDYDTLKEALESAIGS